MQSSLNPLSERIFKGRIENINQIFANLDSGFDENDTVIMNEKLLKEYNVKLDENASIKAGDVITVAAPFVSVLATGCRGNRCEFCFMESKNLLYCDK